MTPKTERAPRILWLTGALFSLLIIADSWFRWATFQYGTFDLAFYVQAFSQALRGEWHVTLLDVPLMGNHAEPITFLLLPFYAIFRHPMVLVVIQTIALATMPFTAWRICQRLNFQKNTTLWLSLATLLTPACGFVALHEFHPEAFAAPLLLLLIEARLSENRKLYWVWFLAVMACKENLALVLVMFAAVYSISDRERDMKWQLSWNIAPGLLALTWFLIYTQMIAPALNGGRVDYAELYSHILTADGWTTKIGKAFGALWKAATQGNLISATFGPLLFLAVLRPRWLLIMSPILAQHLLSWRTSEWSINFHYAAPLIPLIWIATVEVIQKLKHQNRTTFAIVLLCVVSQAWFGPAKSMLQTVRSAQHAQWQAEWKNEYLDSIPSDASVTAGLPYLSHLADRPKLYSLHHILKGLKTLSRETYIPEDPAQYVVLDFGDQATFNRFAGFYHTQVRTSDGYILKSSEGLLHEYLSKSPWEVYGANELTIYRKASKPVEPEANVVIKNWLIDAIATKGRPGDKARFQLKWWLGQQRKSFPWTSFHFSTPDGAVYEIRKGPALLGFSGPGYSEIWSARIPQSIESKSYKLTVIVHAAHPGEEPQEPQHSLLGIFRF